MATIYGMDKKTTLYLPEDLAIALRETARRSGLSQADIVREALRRHLAEHGRPALSSVGAGEDAELSGAETEAWLQGEWSRP